MVQAAMTVVLTSSDAAAPAAAVGDAGLWTAAERAVSRVVGAPLNVAAGWIAPRLGGGADRAIGWTWIASGALVLLMLGAAQLRHRRQRRGWPVRRVGDVAVRVAPDAGPMVVGLLRPVIVVPQWLESAPAEEQRAMLVHEQEHVRARDPWLLALGAAAVVLLPWHPAVWWMAARLRLAVELDCDRRVLRRGVRRAAYGAALLDVAGRRSAYAVAAPALLLSPSQLERRLTAMTTRTTRFAPARGLGLAALGAVLVLAACEAKMPTAAEIDRMDLAAVENSAKRMRIVSFGDDANTSYTLDGAPITAEEARALAPERIAAIEVQKQTVQMGEGAATQSATVAIFTPEGIAARDGEEMVAPGGRGEQIIVRRKQANGAPEVEERIVVRGGDATSGPELDGRNFEGLLVIDGKISEPGAMRALAPDRIHSVEVVKGAAATKMYDDPRAANGVIKITTKAAAAKKQ
jgi:hypothetical protein